MLAHPCQRRASSWRDVDLANANHALNSAAMLLTRPSLLAQL